MQKPVKPEEYPIIDLIPQRPPFVMVDRLTSCTENAACGSLFIRESNLLCQNGFLQESGLMECIAQTAAAFTGYRQRSAGREVVRGYIGAVKNLVVYSLPAVNTEIHAEIIVENELLGYTIVTGKIFGNKILLAECEMRILLDSDSRV